MKPSIRTAVSVLAVAGALAVVADARGDDLWLIGHVASKHYGTTLQWTDEQGNEHTLSESNPGLGLAYGWTETVEVRAGFFINSFENTSAYAGAHVHTSYERLLSVGVQAGIATGYKNTPIGGDHPLIGYVLPTVGLNFNSFRVELGYIPEVASSELKSSVLTLSLAFKLK